MYCAISMQCDSMEGKDGFFYMEHFLRVFFKRKLVVFPGTPDLEPSGHTSEPLISVPPLPLSCED